MQKSSRQRASISNSSRVNNFSAGPSALPLEVLDTIRSDLPDWQGTGMSVMEVSHRSAEFIELARRCEANVRELLGVPDDYSVLFPQGGATLQMSMTPMNLAAAGNTAEYVVTGSWSKKAATEAQKFCDARIVADASDQGTVIGREIALCEFRVESGQTVGIGGARMGCFRTSTPRIFGIDRYRKHIALDDVEVAVFAGAAGGRIGLGIDNNAAARLRIGCR